MQNISIDEQREYEQIKLVKPSLDQHQWAVILAGGEGARLQSLTRFVSGDDRPKQFCPLLGGKTLLAQTRLRTARGIARDRTLLVLTRPHKPFYAEELAELPSIRMVVQPLNRGTLPAILWTLLRLVRLDERALVAFFPSDHYYSDEARFMAGVASALEIAEADPRFLILLGAEPKHAEVEFGWIEPGEAIVNRFSYPLTRVKRFWEKPASQVAQELMKQGCLWNTFVMVGRALTFLETIQSAAPDLYRIFASVLKQSRPENEARMMGAIYDRLATIDFSREILAASTERLAVLSLGDPGWSDLGDPRRVIATLSESRVEDPWIGLWHRYGETPSQ